eukprot:305608-Chlamydomonas_euryale.AAC.6
MGSTNPYSGSAWVKRFGPWRTRPSKDAGKSSALETKVDARTGRGTPGRPTTAGRCIPMGAGHRAVS